jgi:hypothetical protein
MKSFLKISSLLAFIFFTINLSHAQHMQAGTRMVQAGLGLGGWATYSSQTPIISASYMHGINDDFLDGKLAVGGSIGYKSATYHSGYDYTWKWNYTFIAGRATWHPNFIDIDKLDTYAGLGLGLLMVKFDARGDRYAAESGGSSLVLTGLIGARYAFSDHWGAYVEIGNNLGYLTLGASYTL